MPFRTPRTAALVAAAVPLLVLGTAAPGSAAATTLTKWNANLTFGTGDVSGALTAARSGGLLQDYADPTQADHVGSLQGKAERLTINGLGTCATGPTFVSRVSIYGSRPDWTNISAGGVDPVGANVQINCKTPNGLQHKITWGAAIVSGGAWDRTATTNCVSLSRTASDAFALVADASCAVQDAVIDSQGRFIGQPTQSAIPFTLTLDVPGFNG